MSIINSLTSSIAYDLSPVLCDVRVIGKIVSYLDRLKSHTRGLFDHEITISRMFMRLAKAFCSIYNLLRFSEWLDPDHLDGTGLTVLHVLV